MRVRGAAVRDSFKSPQLCLPTSALPVCNRYGLMLRKPSRAGTYAEQRYRRGLRSWQARNRRLFATLCGPFLVAGVIVGILDRDPVAWSAGFVAGAFLALWIVLRDSPPRYVESWRDGAEGERKTPKALRPLERAGWHVVHDIQNGRGNYDHVAVGPSGVYLLESKNLQGVVTVMGGVPHLARRHDPEGAVDFKRVRPHALAGAARLKEEIEKRTGRRIWVQAAVVFWSEFPEGVIEDGRCFFIEGARLREWLQSRPGRLGEADVEEIAAGLAGIESHMSRKAIPVGSEPKPA